MVEGTKEKDRDVVEEAREVVMKTTARLMPTLRATAGTTSRSTLRARGYTMLEALQAVLGVQ